MGKVKASVEIKRQALEQEKEILSSLIYESEINLEYLKIQLKQIEDDLINLEVNDEV